MITQLKQSFSINQERLKLLEQVVPEAFADGKINWETLKEALDEYLEDEEPGAEHFGLSWPGKREARKLASLPSKGTLVPVLGEGVNEETTGNIFIEGDNLEVLKLLQKSYAGRIKMIYIDPPYNTGNDFIYNDDFSEPLESYLRKTSQADEEGQLLTSNPKASGRFHSKWLSMMYPRLRLAKNLLRDEGVIFVSIDDNEVHNLRQVMNEIFGEENFVSQIVIQSNKRGQTYKDISKTHEYLICYTNDVDTELYELEKEINDLIYKDAISMYNIRELRNRNPKFGRFNRPNLFFPIYVAPNIKDENGFHPISMLKSLDFSIEVFPLNSEGKESCWRWSQNKITKQEIADLSKTSLIAKSKRDGGWNIYEKYRKTTYKAKSIWDENGVISEQGTIDIRELSLKGIFDFPKPVHLVKKALAIGSEEDDIILDFFAGSSTSAQAVMELNKEDGGNRKFICVQLPEKTPKDSQAYKLGYKTIADISKERIRQAIKKMRTGETNHQKQDMGFKVFKVERSNFKVWQNYQGFDIQELQTSFLNFENSLVEGWKEQDVVTEILLLEGFLLNSRVTQQPQFASNGVLRIESDCIDHKIFICLDGQLADETIHQLQLPQKEDVFVCLDSALTDTAKMQLADICNIKTI